MGKAIGRWLGVAPKTPSKPRRFGGGFSGQKLSDVMREEDPRNGVTGERHQKHLDPEASRKIVLGHTAAPLDIAYFENYNNQKQYDEIVIVAGHEIDSFDGTFYYEGELLTFDGSGNNLEDFGSNMNFKTKTVGVTGVKLSAGAGTLWTTTSSLTGCAYFSIRYIFKSKLFPNNISMEYMVPVKGAKVFDPRNGAHDPTDQTTWRYNDLVDATPTDIGRNPALQILWYLLGWKIAGEVVCGKGIDVDDIDMQSFITAANDYDTIGVGSTPWYSDCVLSMGDTDATNLSILKHGCGATLTDAGGLYSIHAPIDDTGTVAVNIDEKDLAGDRLSWKPSHGMQDQFNSVSGSFIDPSAQYRSRAYPKVEEASYVTADGYAKNKTRDYQSVQSDDQAQELNRITLNQTRYQGILKMSINQKGLIAKHYDVVEVSLPIYEFVNKKFRVKKQGITTKGYIELELQETDSSIYTGGTITTLPALPTGTPYDDRTQFTVSNLTVVTKTETGSGSIPTISDGLRISWDDPGNIVAWTEIRYRRTGESIWLIAPSVHYPEIEISLIPLESLTQYDVQARHQSVVGVVGAWSSTVQQTTLGNRDTDPGATATPMLNQFANGLTDIQGQRDHFVIAVSGLVPGFTNHVTAGIADHPLDPTSGTIYQIWRNTTVPITVGVDFLDLGLAGWQEPIVGEDFTWGFYYINNDTEDIVVQLSGDGDITLAANTTAWTWITAKGSTAARNWLAEYSAIPATPDGHAYITGIFATYGHYTQSLPPLSWATTVIDIEQVKRLAGWVTVPEDASTLGSTKYASYTALRAATAGGDTIVQVAGKPDFKWDAASTELDNGWTVIIPNSITHPAAGRWVIQLIDSGVFDASWDEDWVADYVPDPTTPTGTDMHAVLQAQSDWLSTQIVQSDATTGKRQALKWIIPYHAKLTDTLKVRSGVEIDTRGVLYNHLSDNYEFMIHIMAGAQVSSLNFWGRNQGGVQIGNGAAPFSKYSGALGLVNGGSQTGGSLITDGWANSTLIASDGDWINVGGNDYLVTADGTSDGSGNLTLSISPDLVSSPLNNAAITFVGVLNDININTIRGWAVGESATGGANTPGFDQMVGIYFTGFNIEYDHIEVDGGNVGIDFNALSDLRGGYALSVTASTAFRITTGSEQLDWGVIVCDSPNYKSFQIDSSSNFTGEIRCFFNETAFPATDNHTSGFVGDIGQYSSGDPVQHYTLKVDMVNTNGVGVKFWYTEHGAVDLLCSETALHTTETEPTTYVAAFDATGFSAARQETMMINIVGAGSSGVWSGSRPTDMAYLAESNGDASFYGKLLYFDQSADRMGIKESSPDYVLDVNGDFGFTPGSSVTPVDNGDVVFEFTSNTTLKVKAKGTDGTVREGTITLS